MQIVGIFGLLISVWWVIQLTLTLRKPPDWRPARADEFPIRVTRGVYLVACVLGIVSGLAVFVFGVFVAPSLAS
jgi:hypothetical protein